MGCFSPGAHDVGGDELPYILLHGQPAKLPLEESGICEWSQDYILAWRIGPTAAPAKVPQQE